MTDPLAQTVTVDEAGKLRRVAAAETKSTERASALATLLADRNDGHGRLWSPIEVVEATGKARCRLCSQTIPKGERCIRFGFDPYGEGSWGRLSAAYLHLTECPETEGER